MSSAIPQHLLSSSEKMQNEKSPGANRLPPNTFKYLDKENLIHLLEILTLVWNTDYEPETWHMVKLIILPKKGDLADLINHRGISLFDIASKILSSFIANRSEDYLFTFGIDKQVGSTKNKGCVDATFTLKVALQTLYKHNQEAWVLFIDATL